MGVRWVLNVSMGLLAFLWILTHPVQALDYINQAAGFAKEENLLGEILKPHSVRNWDHGNDEYSG